MNKAIDRRRLLRRGALAALALCGGAEAVATRVSGQRPPRTILVWSEGSAPKDVYPDDIRGAIADALKGLPGGYVVKTATLADPGQGVPEADLADAAALFWWGHVKHGEVTDATVARIVRRVREGMGFVALHSSHFAKPFQAVVGASGAWKAYVNDGKPHHLTVADPKHPVARGVPRAFTLPREERYEEPFVVPSPEAVVFEGRHESTDTSARQGLCWTVGKGRVFYFRPGHETYPVYRQPEVRRVLRNAALWAAGDDAAVWEDADPSAKAARAAGEPPLAVILRDLGYGGTDVTAGGEVRFGGLFARAEAGAPVTFTPLAAYGTLKTTRGGWYRVKGDLTDRVALWQIDGPNNKRMRPPLMPGGKTTFDPGADPFGLWISSESFPGETIYTEDARQAAIKRFGRNLHKAHAYAAVRSDGTPVPDAVLIGFEYSTNDDNQEIVALLENVRPLPPAA